VAATTPAATTAGELGALVLRGLRWKVAGQVAAQLSRTLSTVILARLLTPHEFGVAAMALVVTAVAQLLTDVGFSASIVQQRTLCERDRATAFWTNAVAGILLCVACVAVAAPIADFYGEPRVRALVVALSPTFVLAALGSTHAALLKRRLDFGKLELAAVIGTAAGVTAALVVAFLGGGSWALVAQALAATATTTVAIWLLASWRPRLTYSRASLAKLWGFGAPVFGARALAFLSRNTDNLLVGRVLGAQALGVYSVAYSVIVLPFERIIGPLQAVLQPALARLQDDVAEARRLWLTGVRAAAGIMMPATVGAIVLAPDLVHVVLGARWGGVTDVLRVLAWVACVQTLTSLSPLVLQSQYRTGLLLGATAVAYAAHVTGFVVGLRWGVVGVATGYAVSTTLVSVPLLIALPLRVLGSSLRELVDVLASTVTATLGVAGAAVGSRALLVALDLTAPSRLAIVTLVGLATYLFMLRLLEPSIYLRAARAVLAALGREPTEPAPAVPVTAD
jgi:O-antigen/teichoic acid export membrane protein